MDDGRSKNIPEGSIEEDIEIIAYVKSRIQNFKKISAEDIFSNYLYEVKFKFLTFCVQIKYFWILISSC